MLEVLKQQKKEQSALENLLKGATGFLTGMKLEPEEFDKVKSAIENHWLENIQKLTPQYADRFALKGMTKYHELSHSIDHGLAFRKKARILPASFVEQMRNMPIFKKLTAKFGKFDFYNDEIYWRIVRPNHPEDVGPLHADKWFWEVKPEDGDPRINKQIEPIKCWIAIACQPGRDGLRVVSGSHLREWPYHAEKRHNTIKPQIDVNESEFSIELFRSEPGDLILFGDKLIHGGAKTTGEFCRISLEFTMQVPKC